MQVVETDVNTNGFLWNRISSGARERVEKFYERSDQSMQLHPCMPVSVGYCYYGMHSCMGVSVYITAFSCMTTNACIWYALA